MDIAATHRLTRLLTEDSLLHGPRDALVRRAYRKHGRAMVEQPVPDYPGAWAEVARADTNPPKLAKLITCRWCTSVWVAAGVVVARRVRPGWWQPVADLLALSSASTLLARAEA